MTKSKDSNRFILSLLFISLLSLGCERDVEELGLEEASFPTTANVFIDGFAGDMEYAAFGGSVPTAFQTDDEVSYEGTSSMRIEVPDFEDPRGAFAGGVLFSLSGRDLSGYNVLSFWAKATKSANIDVVGIGNDLGLNRFEASIAGVPVNTNWNKYYIPIPDASKLTNEKGLFYFSEGPEVERGYTIWFDEIQFESLGTIARGPALIMGGQDVTQDAETGNSFEVEAVAQFNLPTGVDLTVFPSPAYFSFNSSDPSVATVDDSGTVRVLDAGTTVITAELSGIEAEGSFTVNSTGEAIKPESPAPVPSIPADDVISVFSNAYQDIPVDFYNGFWEFSTTQNEIVQVDGDDIMRYSQLNFVGIQFTAPTQDISGMTHMHMDIWTPDATELPNAFRILLFDLAADNSFDDPNSSHELSITSPTLASEQWVSLDIPLTDFAGLTTKMNLAQIVLSGDLSNVFVDNMYFYNDGMVMEPQEPEVGAPEPDEDPANVISVFSDSYTNIPGTDFFPDWGQATIVTQELIQGNNTLKYAGLNYQGVQLAESQNVSEMEFLHIDYWTDNSSQLSTFLISTGPVEVPYNLAVPTNGWNSVDIPLSEFADVDLMELIQFKFEGNGTIYLDNIYFYKEGENMGTGPLVAAPEPERDAANVLSIFSDTYNNVPGTDLNPNWGQGTIVTQESIAGNNTLVYSDLNFQGIQLAESQDVSQLEFLHLDYWTDNSELLNTFLISTGPVEMAFNLPVPTTGWASVDIPLEAFGSVDLGDIIQFKFDGNGKIYLDNIYFFKESGGLSDEPESAAPVPTLPQMNVISLFSDAYNDVPVDTWRTDWSSADFEDVTVDGNPTKKYANLDFVGVETVANQIDATAMTHFHLNVWSSDFSFFAIKIVDFGADGAFGGGDDVEHQVEFQMPVQGQWVSYDIPFTDFPGLTTRSNLAQIIFVAQPTGMNTVFIDNVYLHN